MYNFEKFEKLQEKVALYTTEEHLQNMLNALTTNEKLREKFPNFFVSVCDIYFVSKETYTKGNKLCKYVLVFSAPTIDCPYYRRELYRATLDALNGDNYEDCYKCYELVATETCEFLDANTYDSLKVCAKNTEKYLDTIERRKVRYELCKGVVVA